MWQRHHHPSRSLSSFSAWTEHLQLAHSPTCSLNTQAENLHLASWHVGSFSTTWAGNKWVRRCCKCMSRLFRPSESSHIASSDKATLAQSLTSASLPRSGPLCRMSALSKDCRMSQKSTGQTTTLLVKPVALWQRSNGYHFVSICS